MSDELKAQDCELEYWNQQAEDYAQVQIPCEDLRAIINRAWEAPAFNSALTAAEAERNRAQLACQQIAERLTASEARAKAAEERVSALSALATLGLTASQYWPVGDFDAGDIQDQMERLGLIKKSDEPYNRDKHGDIDECYEGEEFYLYTEIYYAATKALKGAPDER